MRNRAGRLILILLSIVIAISFVGCQNVSGTSISGVVESESGVVSGARLTAVPSKPEGSKYTVYTTKSSRDGYKLSLPPGSYDIRVESGGHEDYLKEGVKVPDSSSLVMDIHLLPKGTPLRFAPDSSGYVFAGGAPTENEVVKILAVFGLIGEKVDIESITPRIKSGSNLSIYYRDGLTVAVRNGSFKNEPVWEVVLFGRNEISTIYIQRKCGNIVIAGKVKVVVTATPAPRVPTCTPTPVCVPEATQTPVSTSTPTSTCVPEPTVTPTPTSTRWPTSTATSTPQPTSTPTPEESLYVELTADPGSGEAPLGGVDLIADVSGTAKGPIEYNFYCFPGNLARTVVTNDTSFAAVDLCSYPVAGQYNPEVRVIRGEKTAGGNAGVVVTAPPTPVPPATSTPQPTPTIARTLYVELVPSSNSGPAPLNGVVLKATVSGSASGSITYRFNCGTGGADSTFGPTSNTSHEIVCDYPFPGSFSPTVWVDRGGLSVGGNAGVTTW